MKNGFGFSATLFLVALSSNIAAKAQSFSPSLAFQPLPDSVTAIQPAQVLQEIDVALTSASSGQTVTITQLRVYKNTSPDGSFVFCGSALISGQQSLFAISTSAPSVLVHLTAIDFQTLGCNTKGGTNVLAAPQMFGASADQNQAVAQPDPNFQPKMDDITAPPAEQLLPAMARLISDSIGGKSVTVTKVHLYENADGQSNVGCGTALISGNSSRFAVSTASAATTYIDLSDAEWGALGCNTQGGVEIVAAHTGRLGPAKPPQTIPFAARAELQLEFADSLSQEFGMHVFLESARVYMEQDDTSTFCMTGFANGKRFRMIERAGDKSLLQPSQAQWVARGCTRPNFLFIG